VMIHPDFQYDPTKACEMIAPIIAGTADMVMGSRFMQNDPRKCGMVWWRYYGNKLLTFLQNIVLGTRLSECHSGYRAYSRKLLLAVPYRTFSDHFVFDAQMVASVARHSMRIGEVSVPVRYQPGSSSISFVASVRYGLSTLRTLLR